MKQKKLYWKMRAAVLFALICVTLSSWAENNFSYTWDASTATLTLKARMGETGILKRTDMYNLDKSIYKNAKIVKIDYTINEIYQFAFYDFSSIESLMIEATKSELILHQWAFSAYPTMANGQAPRIKNFSCARPFKYVLEEDSDPTDTRFGLFSGSLHLETVTLDGYAGDIPYACFYDCFRLQSVSLGSKSITKIGDYAFAQCPCFSWINIDSGVTEIGANAFQGCTDLVDVQISSNAIASKNYTLSDNLSSIFPNATKVVLNYVEELGDYAFAGASSLVKVYTYGSVNIHDNAFTGCSNTLTVDDVVWTDNQDETITYNDWKALYAHTHNTINTLYIPNNNIANSSYTVSDNLTAYFPLVQNVVFGPHVTDIATWIFYGATSITNVVLGENVANIQRNAFAGCTNLKTLTMGCKTAPKISGDAMSKTINFGSAFPYLTKVRIANSCTNVPNYAFYNNVNLKEVDFARNSIIGEYSFANCTGLTTLTGQVSDIKSHAFAGSSIKSIAIKFITEAIGEGAFEDCTQLANVQLPNETYNIMIGSRSFANCRNLTEFILPAKTRSIASDAFEGCTYLKTLYVYSKDLATETDNLIGSKFPNVKKLILGGNITTIKNDFFTSAKLNEVILTDNVNDIYSLAFRGCTNLKKLTIQNDAAINKEFDERGPFHCAFMNITDLVIGENVTNIGDNAFNDSEYGQGSFGLKNVTFEGTNTSVGKYAFCWFGLENVNGSVKSVDEGSFYYTNIKSITVTDDNCIESEAFSGCSALETVNLPSGLTTINANAFADCKKLNNVTIPANVETIDNAAFNGCAGLTKLCINSGNLVDATYADSNNLLTKFPKVTELIYGSDISNVGEYSFSYSSTNDAFTPALKEVTFLREEGVSVKRNAFYGLSSLQTINGNVNDVDRSSFGNSGITEITIINDEVIDMAAFVGCVSLAKVNLLSGVKEIGSAAFKGCTALTSIDIPSSVTTYGKWAFKGCSKLSLVKVNNTVPAKLDESSYVFDGLPSNAELDVPYASISAYKSAPVWKDFFDFYATEGMKLADGAEYTQSDNTEEYPIIRYTRDFNSADTWQALYIPFVVDYADWSENFEVARINDVHQWDTDEDGEADETAIEIFAVKKGSLEPNTPYLIKAKATGTQYIQHTGGTLYAAEEKSYDVSSWNTIFTFTGTYSGITGEDMVSEGYYALGGGSLHQAESAGNDLSSFRWYMSVTDRNGNPKNINEVKVMMRGDDGTLTDIRGIENHQPSTIYNLSGSRVSKMTKGIYIKNGKKYFVK